MTAREYLEALRSALASMEPGERDDFVKEMESHIDELKERHPEKGEEELVDALTPPDALAAELTDGKGRGDRQEAGGRERGHDGSGARHARGSRAEGLSGLGVRLRDALETLGHKLEGLDLDLDLNLDLGPLGPKEGDRYGEGEIEKVFPADGLDAIRLEAFSAEVRVLPSSTAEARFVARGERGAVNFAFEQESGELAIIERSAGRHAADEIRLELPGNLVRARVVTRSGDIALEGIACELELKTASGDVEARSCPGALSIETISGDVDAQEVGTLAVRTASGDVSASGVSGSAAARSASGDIELERVGGDAAGESASGSVGIDTCAGRAAARAISGDVSVSGVGGRVTVGASSGSVELDSSRGFSGAEISTVSGNVYVELPADVDAELAWSTVSGGITIEGAHGKRGSLALGAGGEGLVIKTASGDIGVDW